MIGAITFLNNMIREDWINYFNNLSLFVMFTNQLNQSTNKSILRVDLLHTKSIHTPYTVSGILGKSKDKKNLILIQNEAFMSGSYRIRTYDPLLVRQVL
jgi:hypothetical protein